VDRHVGGAVGGTAAAIGCPLRAACKGMEIARVYRCAQPKRGAGGRGGSGHGVNANGLGAVAAQPTLWRLCLVRTWAHGAGEARYSSVTVTGPGTIEGYNEFEDAGAVPVLSLPMFVSAFWSFWPPKADANYQTLSF
jgi:hypothetical protein